MLLPTGALGAAGDLDRSFSDDGRLSLLAAGPFVARAVAVTPDGGILVAGYSCQPDSSSANGICQTDGDSSFRVARFTADGGLDTEFGDKGLVTTKIGVARSQAFDLLVQPSGGIVVGGVARDSGGRDGRDTFALVRYDAAGGLDTSFGNQGVALTRVGTGFAAIADLAAGPDGTIVATGQGLDPTGEPKVAIARYDRDGRLDTSFNAPVGYSLPGAAAYNYGLGAVVAGDGSVIAAGLSGPTADPSSHRFSAFRVTPTGSADPAFDGDGTAEYGIGTSSSFANAVAGLADGRWVAAGAATDGSGRQAMGLVRGTATGAIDTSWGADGVVLTRLGDGSLAHDVLVQPDGRTLAVGQAAAGESYSFAVARYTTAGALDPEFGAGGTVATGWSNFPVARGTAAALQPDGRLLVTGIGCHEGSQISCQGGTAVLLLARYLADPPRPPPPAPRPPPRDARAPAARFLDLPARMRRRTFVRKGVLVRLDVDEVANVSAALFGRGSGRTVLANRRGRRAGFTLELGRRTLGYARGRRTVRLRPRRRAIGRVRRFTVRVVVQLSDQSGNVTTLRRAIRIR